MACTQSSAPDATDAALGPGQVATVNGKRIPESLFRVYTPAAMRKNADELTPEERKAVIDDLAGIMLMADEAQKTGLAEGADDRRAARAGATAIDRARDGDALSRTEPASDGRELQALYDENLPAPRGPGVQGAAHPRRDEGRSRFRDPAAAARQELLWISRRSALPGPTGPNGGDLGWFTAASMAQPVVEAVSAMKVGAYSTEPVKTEYGYHVLLLEDTRSQEPPTLDSMRQELTNAVQGKKLQDHVRTLVEAATVV